MTKRVVILTKSYKNGGFCVAGLDVDNNFNWIRLVSDDTESHGAIPKANMWYQDGSSCEVLDVIQAETVGAEPLPYQPENVLIDRQCFFQKIGRATLEDILQWHPPEEYEELLGNKYPYITGERIHTVGHSLVFVRVHNLALLPVMVTPDKTRIKANFTYVPFEGTFQQIPLHYEGISVTDPLFYTVSSVQFYPEAFLVMSLPGSPINNRYYYKFIAKIFLPS